MILRSLATAFPEQRYSHNDCLQALTTAPFWQELTPRSQKISKKIFSPESLIKERRFCVDSIASAWKRNAQEQNEAYEQAAPKLAAQALSKALKKANLCANEIDILYVCSCTGFLCPGVSTHLAELIGMRPDALLQDMTGLGCGAAIPLIHAAAGMASLHPDALVATVAVEICSAAFYADDDPGVLISLSLFGDGAAAALWNGKQAHTKPLPTWKITNFHSLHYPAEREQIRFINANGKLKNQLTKAVPTLVAKAAKELYEKCSKPADALITHGGGRDVVDALEQSLQCAPLEEARQILQFYGNLSSPSVLAALELRLDKCTDDSHLWLCTFGAGFSAHSAELTKVSE